MKKQQPYQWPELPKSNLISIDKAGRLCFEDFAVHADQLSNKAFRKSNRFRIACAVAAAACSRERNKVGIIINTESAFKYDVAAREWGRLGGWL